MGRSYFLAILLLSSVLTHSFSHEGRGRKELRFEQRKSVLLDENQEKIENRREMVEFTMDYSDPGANINPITGNVTNPPPPVNNNQP